MNLYSLKDQAEILLHKIKQRTVHVDAYNDEFEKIVVNLPANIYSDKILLYHYKRELNNKIHSRLQTNIDNDSWTLEEWKEYVQCIKIQQVQANAIQSNSQY